MRSKFIAMPVSQGDFFYLERGEKTIVFDGGINEKEAPRLFKEHSGRKVINYLVCSHNDADHANGVLGLLKDKDIQVAEAWLPRLWKEIIAEIYNRKNWIEDTLRECLEENVNFIGGIEKRIEERGESRHDNELTDLLEGKGINELIEKIIESDVYRQFEVFNTEFVFNDQMNSGRRQRDLNVILNLIKKNGGVCYPNISNNSELMFKKAVNNGKKIIEIAKNAIQKKVLIRWFDHKEFKETGSPTGGELILKPLNSVENHKTQCYKMKLFYRLYLSQANRESLAFISEMDNEPSVIFTADSNLKKVKIDKTKSREDFLVTSAHHGSEHNCNVYSLIFSFLDREPYWVRSDYVNIKRPCIEYKNQSNKFCTICNNNSNLNAVVIKSINNKWDIKKQIKCRCA